MRYGRSHWRNDKKFGLSISVRVDFRNVNEVDDEPSEKGLRRKGLGSGGRSETSLQWKVTNFR